MIDLRTEGPGECPPDAHPQAEAGSTAGTKGVALVTGGSRGLGRAVALGLGAAGFAVAVLARSANALEEARCEIERQGVPSAACVADVTDPIAVARAVAAAENALGPISTLVNNAGTSLAVGPMWEVDAHDWWTDVQTSLGGTFNLCRSVIPGMIARRRGRILNVSSYAGVRAAPYQNGYGCAKAAVTSLTESLAASLSAHGVQVFAITSGFVHTDLNRRLTESAWLPEARTRDNADLSPFVRLAVMLALGRADALNGRFLHALDDVSELLRQIDMVDRDELYVLRLRRLQGS